MSNTTNYNKDFYPLRLPHVLAVVILSGLFVSFIYLTRENIVFYFRDPAATFGFSPFAGLISNVGIFALFAAGAISIFSSFHTENDKVLLSCSGVFTTLIAIDDFFMLHEDIIPRKLGVSESYVYIFYGILAVTILIYCRRAILGKEHIGLYVSASFLAFSGIVDVIIDHVEIEDTFKFLGITVWAAYWIRRSHCSIAEQLR